MDVNKLVLDSYALIAYFEAEEGAEEVKHLLQEAESGKLSLMMSVVNWGEVYYILHRSKGEDIAEESILIMDQLPISILDVDRHLAHRAAELKAGHPLAFGDCFAAALALMNEARVLTGDPEFRRLEKEVAVEWIG